MKKIEDNKSIIQQENGSITLFVLIAMIFVLIIVCTIYITKQNELLEQEKEINEIQESYNIDNNELLDEYNDSIE